MHSRTVMALCGLLCRTTSALLALSGHCPAATEPVIAIDVGHSTLHPGANSARGIPEFEFNAALAKVIRETLDGRGARSALLGEDGKMDNLQNRAIAAGTAGATFFLSIHHDSAQPQYFQRWDWQGVGRQYSDQFSGFSLFVSRKNPYTQASLHCASMIGAALSREGFHPSPHHAEDIPGEAKEWADQENGVYYYDNLVVLKSVTMPAVLLEAGLIVNRTEEQRLQELQTRSAIAEAVVRGMSDCGAIK